MRPAKVLFSLVIASAAAFATTSLIMDVYPQYGTALADAPGRSNTPELARSVLFRLYQDFRRRHGDARTAARRSRAGVDEDELTTYAKQCEFATGIKIPDFSCLDGEEVPGQTRDSEGLCRAPNVLNHACDPGSHFQVLKGRTANAVAVAHCRKKGLPANQTSGEDFWNDIAIIQYNKQNGAICFYQALGDDDVFLPGSNIPSPRKGLTAKWADGEPHWFTPTVTEGIGCTGCHDNGGFVRSPYIIQTKKHKLPSVAEGFDNKTIPLRYVGAAFAKNRSWSIETSNAEGDKGTNCARCHRLAVSNHPLVKAGADDPDNPNKIHLGSAFAFAVISTDESQEDKVPHSTKSSIWMRPGQVTYDEAAEATAEKFRNCAKLFAQSNFTKEPPGCKLTLLGRPRPLWR